MADGTLVLELTVGGRPCALPADAVVEVFRPLPVVAVGEPTPGVLGLVRVRGQALPLVDLNPLLGAPAAVAARFVHLRVEARGVVLAVEGVSGVRHLDPAQLQALPALLADAAPAVEAVAGRDPALLLLLRSARLLPADPGQGAAA